MTPERFRELAETWGGDIARWPEAERGAARVIAQSESGSVLLRQQQAFDALLSVPPEVTPARASRAALAVLQAIAAREARPPWYRRWLRPVSLLPVGSLACSALLGVWLAGALPYHQNEQAVATVAAVLDASVISLWGNQ